MYYKAEDLEEAAQTANSLLTYLIALSRVMPAGSNDRSATLSGFLLPFTTVSPCEEAAGPHSSLLSVLWWEGASLWWAGASCRRGIMSAIDLVICKSRVW